MRHKGAERCHECCLPNVFLFDTDLLVGIGHIGLGPISTSSYIHSNLVLVRERSDILKGVVIPFAGVNHSVKLTTLLRYTKKRCSLIYGLHLPPPSCSVLGDLLPKLLLKSFGASGHMIVVPNIFVHQGNSMIDFPEWG